MKAGSAVQRLVAFFRNWFPPVSDWPRIRCVGMEVETQFVKECSEEPITVDQSQLILARVLASNDRSYIDQACSTWDISSSKGGLITELSFRARDYLRFDLGRHNLELATRKYCNESPIGEAKKILNQVYDATRRAGAQPYFGPILETPEENDLLIVPDERDAEFVQLDGRAPLNLLARTSSVQFSIDVTSEEDAVRMLNALGKALPDFLADYPQDAVWRRYIKESLAGYREDRYGGPLQFDSLEDYCERLVEHHIISGGRLVPHEVVSDEQFDPGRFVKSVWWYFRLRHGYIEVRPLARRSDDRFEEQLALVVKSAGIVLS